MTNNQNSAKEKKRDLKPVSFNYDNERDVKLLEYAQKAGMKFGTYVKFLIEKEMNGSNNNNLDINSIANAINQLTKVIESKSFVTNSISSDNIDDKPKKLSDKDKETKNIISGILNMNSK
ncbi:hypothetical protein FDC50_12840 [Clostridium botulinum]|nr:hypothetical protein [Clostridium botulinum]ACD14155.1 hypothetical protein CLL_0048 [Clostridium botulinum B str. Eklund 17B (NRP)]KFX53709.1 hypothetical protein KU40_19070 [Clostridium botulinum]KFX57892.1 hypothetical protein KU41_08680 [Clostridium botulinum]MBY6780615.1 hypothetical protein [Clostridium botulinum]MBY6805202.1 hypothetical protein [Clostridium botulinum]